MWIVYRHIWVSGIFSKTSQDDDATRRGAKIRFGWKKPWELIKLHYRQVTSSDRHLKIFRGPGAPRPNITLEAPRPLLGTGFYMEKIFAYQNNYQRKKLFCVKTLTKLPKLTA